MNRKDFIKRIGLAGAGMTLASNRATSMPNSTDIKDGCVLIPSETAGPFPWDLTDNSSFFRSDVREDRAGIPLNVKLRIVGDNNCSPMPNVRVHIWHCDKDGFYSAYDNSMNQGQAGKTYLRGWQIADSNGEVNFITIFPGWYNGRICHIHFQVYVSSVYAATSQLTFDIAEKNALYAKHSTIYTKGIDPTLLSGDNIFRDGYAYQLAHVTESDDGTSYNTFLEVTVKGTGTTGLIEAEPETGGHFTLGQNFPNPFLERTTIPFFLARQSDVRLDVFEISGRKISTILNAFLSEGDHEAVVDVASLGLSTGSYAYQLEIKNSHGTFRQNKLMTGAFK